MVDLICSRYPGTKPSNYLGIKDKFTAFQLDLSCASQGKIKDLERQNQMLEVITEHLLMVCKSLGAKIKKKDNRPKVTPNYEERPLNEVLQELGGAGVVIE